MLRFDQIRFSPRFYILTILLLSIFLCFWKLGTHPLHQWDESRYGENAYWMLQKGDYVNFYYADEIDTWNAKPPLTAWLISLNYRIFGFNEWALRMHSAVAGVLFFMVFYVLLLIYKPPIFAFISSLILLSVKGLIGHHVARTGDTDALLVLFLMASLYFSLLYIDYKKKWAVIPAFLMLGLAFYAKGFTFLFYLPGVGVYLLLRQRLIPLLKEWRFWAGLMMLGLTIFSWYFLVKQYGIPFEDERYPGTNSWEVMINYDILARFTESGVEGNDQPVDYLFLLKALDVKFNLWNYVMYMGILIASVKLYFKRSNLRRWFMHKENRIYLLSISIFLTLGGLLTISQSKLIWYVAPLVPFGAILCTWGIAKAVRWKNITGYLWLGLILFTLGRQVYYVNDVPENYGSMIRENKTQLASGQNIWLYHPHNQDVRLYADWFHHSVKYTEAPLSTISQHPEDGVIGHFDIGELEGKGEFICRDEICVFLPMR
ncbi:MAG: glycosyltransferase family 39 protein [Bacteroidetes bacterium]|nr:glycosyltransferase family 39 protein [Bacteroidota bacterium]